MSVATQPFVGSYEADPVHSSFGFAVRHMGVSTFRGSFTEVAAGLRGRENGGLVLEGEAAVESISIVDPPEFRAHVLSEEFFDAERHPKVRFRSEDLQLGADGSASARGELTIKGITVPVTATGSYTTPTEDPFGSQRGALELEATVDRREFAMRWNTPMPKGGDALAPEVVVSVHIELVEAG